MTDEFTHNPDTTTKDSTAPDTFAPESQLTNESVSEAIPESAPEPASEPTSESTPEPECISEVAPAPSAAEDSSIDDLKEMQTQDEPTEKPLEEVTSAINKTISSVAGSLNKDELTKFADKARETLSTGASQGAHTVMEGFEAVRDVHRAAKQTDAARLRLKHVHSELDETKALLAHREDIAQNYQSIIEDQTALRTEAQNHMNKLTSQIANKRTEEDKLRQQLTELRETNRQDLRPYKAKLEQARDKVDEATKVVADAKRALKVAESQQKEVVGRRDEELDYVNQSIKKSTAHIEELHAELATLTAADTLDEKALKQTRKAISKEERALDCAHAEINEITERHRRAVENALTHVYTQRNSLDFAQETLEDAKREAHEHKATYDRLHKDAHGRESEIDKKLASLTKAIADTKKQLDEATARRDTAQALIDEAEEIHATPELTEELHNTIRDTQAAIEVQQRQVQNLEKREAKLREKTKQQRSVFIGVLFAASIVILLILLFVTHIFK